MEQQRSYNDTQLLSTAHIHHIKCFIYVRQVLESSELTVNTFCRYSFFYFYSNFIMYSHTFTWFILLHWGHIRSKWKNIRWVFVCFFVCVHFKIEKQKLLHSFYFGVKATLHLHTSLTWIWAAYSIVDRAWLTLSGRFLWTARFSAGCKSCFWLGHLSRVRGVSLNHHSIVLTACFWV